MLTQLEVLCAALEQLREVWRDERLDALVVSPERLCNEASAVISTYLAEQEEQRVLWQDVPPEVMAYREEGV